jgi:N-acetylmuramoyl-L-alanine amidase
MFAKRRRHAEPKEAILKGVYHDNLRITGRPLAGVRSARKRFGWAQLGALAAAAVMAALILGTGGVRNPLRGPQEKMPPATQPVAVSERGVALGPTIDPGPMPTSAESGDASLLASIPIWDFTASGDQRLEDYRLLLSGDDRVRLSSLFGLGIKTIVIDPGHGGRDPGAIGSLGAKEKEITLDVALRLRQRLSRAGLYQVLLTRDDDRTLSLAGRVAFAQEHKADLFISVHVNSLPDQRLNVIETYYFGPPLNSDTLRLAEQENKESGYALGEINAIVEDIGSTVKRQESARLAAAIQTSLFRNAQSDDALVRDVGIKMAPFVVLSKVGVPSVLVEIACLTKASEEAKLMSPAYREKVAGYMEEGIAAYLNINNAIALHGEKQDD